MINLTDENFQKEIENSPKPFLVDFWAEWCVPCSILSPILEKLEKEYQEKIIFAKAKVDDTPLISQQIGIDVIPAVIIFKNKKPTSGFKGVLPEEQIRKWLDDNLKEENDEVNNLITEYKRYSKENGFELNPNKEIVKRIVVGLIENKKKYGFRYCPCRRVVGNTEEDKQKICPCFWHLDELKKDGHCLCGLFVLPKND